MGKDVQVPFCLSGGIIEAHSSLCMDGATHIINTSIIGGIRLVATTKEALEVLEKHENADIAVAVCGYPKRSANCTHMEIYFAGLAEQFAPKLSALGGMDAGG